MKVNQIRLDDDGDIESVTVTMSLAEATAIRRIAGDLNGYAQVKLGLTADGDSLYDALAELFNRFYDDGLPPGTPRMPLLGTLNDPPD